jgi:hypothetical protein
MSEATLDAIRELLRQCTAEERNVIFRELRKLNSIHEFEAVIGAPAEMILEAVHRVFVGATWVARCDARRQLCLRLQVG